MFKDYTEVMVNAENGDLFRSKKSLREAVKDVPELVIWTLIGTPTNGLRDRLIGRTSALIPYVPPAGVIVHGPDPYNDRKWIATVTVKDNRLVVK